MIDDPLLLAELHLDLLYETDATGIVLRSRDPGVTTPLLHLLRTTAGNRWRLSNALDERKRSLLTDVLSAEPVVPELEAMESSPPLLAGARVLLSVLGIDLTPERGPVFAFSPTLLQHAKVPAEILIVPRDAATVPELAWIHSTGQAEQPLCVIRNPRGQIVAVCHSARSTPHAAEAGVETTHDYRGNGFAGLAVRGWASVVHAQGRVPIYSTSWSNHSSRAVALKLGLVMFGEDFHLG